MSSIIFLILLLSKAPPGDISDLFSWHRLHGFAKDGRFQRAAFESFDITQLALQMIDILFRRDDRIYNLISMLTPKKKGQQRKTSARQVPCDSYRYGFTCTRAGGIPQRRIKMYV